MLLVACKGGDDFRFVISMTFVHMGADDVIDHWRSLIFWPKSPREISVWMYSGFFVGSGLIKVLAIVLCP